ncbi:uncharacterized protein LOC126687737 [Mercurialis annua]|uniref:uncharacterized protein LOC126687737 n=1 Tax=Mercurialis annua TaxID=3986 RepID=UPI0021601EB5|nr:uncharacterized protein LOC126687737 [Mercurialis annua]
MANCDDNVKAECVGLYRELLDLAQLFGRAFIWRNRVHGHHKLFHGYLRENPVYFPTLFRRRFRMNRSLFLRIQSTIKAHDPYFVQKRDVAGHLGLSSLQKITVALHMFAYGVTRLCR